VKHSQAGILRETEMPPRIALVVLSAFILHEAYSQFPFENFPQSKLQQAGPWEVYSRVAKEGKVHWAIKIPNFYGDSSSMTVQLTAFVETTEETRTFISSTTDTSLIRIYRDKKQIQVIREPYPLGANFGRLYDSLSFGDINNDSLIDIKIMAWCGGNGLAAYYHRVVYLFQRPDGTFYKSSFLNMELADYPERDLDGDGNCEIIASHHEYYKDHSYWVFNVYRYDGDQLRCVNNEFHYPILVQMLYRMNYQITDKVTRMEMKKFERKVPDEFSQN
jgi:hypothetical protein